MTNIDETVNLIIQLSHEIKRREYTIRTLHTKSRPTMYRAIYVDICYLQFRKILELIAYCAVSANADAFKKLGKSLKSDFNADKTFRWLEGHYKKSYPSPILEKENEDGIVNFDLLDFEGDFLTRPEFSTLYAKCGDILHTKSPFRKQHNFEEYHENIAKYHRKIRNLLNKFTLRSSDDVHMYLISMNTDDVEMPPMVTAFARVDDLTSD